MISCRDAYLASHDFRIDRKNEFLDRLRSNGKLDYKRYTGSPLRYAGGKSLAVGKIIERIPDDVDHVISPFMGGGSVEVALAKECGIRVDAFDIFNLLVNYWRVQIAEPEALADRLHCLCPDQTTYAEIKERLLLDWRGKPIVDKVERAAFYWFNHNLSYGPGFLGWMSKIYEDPKRVDRMVDKVRRFDGGGNLRVMRSSCHGVILASNGTFLYCDPPYYLDDDSRVFRGIYPQRNFPVHHDGFDHAALCENLHGHKGGFILSYNDCATIRDWYSNFEIVEVDWQYMMGQGETRIGKNRQAEDASHVKKSHELLIIGHR